MKIKSGHISTDRLGEAARLGGLSVLTAAERGHVEGCQSCHSLLGGYQLADRLLAAPWREVRVPASAQMKSRFGLAGFELSVFGHRPSRSLAPAAAVTAVLLMVGAALAMPQLVPFGPSSHSEIATRTKSPAPPTAALSAVPSTAVSPSEVPSSAAIPSGSSPTAPIVTELAVTAVGGSPLAWAPDGAHLLLWGAGNGHLLQIRDAGGRLTGTITADAAAWVNATTIAVATRTPAAADPSATPHGQGNNGNGPGNGNGNAGGANRGDTVSLINLSGQITTSLTADLAPRGLANVMLLGSGSGELAISTSSPGKRPVFYLWNGKLSDGHDGMPIAFSADGGRLAVVQSSGISGPNVTGNLEILSVPSLSNAASFGRLVIHAGQGNLGSAFGFDAAFSPNRTSLLVSGTLVNLASGATSQVGRGGWLPETLVTPSGLGLRLWQGPTPRSIHVSRARAR